MKRAALFLFLFLALVPSFVLAQNFNWITPNRTYLKLYVAEDGMYRLKKSDFTSAGVTTSFDPRTAKLYYMGAQIPMHFQGEQDGVFNDNDYINFFAKRNYGGLTYSREQNNSVAYTTDEYYNQYSDTSVYWLDWGGSNGLRIQTFNNNSTIPFPQQFVKELVHFETDAIYSLGENFGGGDYRYLTTEKLRGEGWYWTILSSNQSVTKTISLPLLSQAGNVATFRVFAYPQNKSTIVNEHSLHLIVNGTVIDTLYSNDSDRIDTTVNFPASLLTTSQNTLEVKYIPASGFAGSMYFDLFEIGYPKAFRFSENSYRSILPQGDTASKSFKISGFNNLGSLFIYDVANNIRIQQFTTSADTLKFTAKGNARFEIHNDTIRKSPVRIKARQVPDLVSSANGADYMIIYNKLFESQAEQLRAYRQTSDNYRSYKAEIEDIYDIFGYGMENPLAVRYFVKHVNDNWQLPKIKYVTLFGRGSLDPKKNKPSSAYYQNLIPVYGNPPSDGYFVNFNMGTFFYYPQVAVGRIPVYYTSEAQTVVDKIIAYESEPHGDWNKTYTFITGGGSPYEQYYHQQKSNFEAFVYVEPPVLSSYAAKVYRTDTSGTVTYNYADSIRNTIDRGSAFVNFRGHAGSHDWEVGMHDPNVLSNGNKLPIVLSLTCFTGENALGDFRGFGERFLYLQGKGAIGFVGTTGWSFGDVGNTFGTYLLQAIKRDTIRKIGDLTKAAAKGMINDSLSFSVTHTVNCYNLIGDAAAKLRVPKTPEFEIKNEDCKLLNETVLAGERQTLTILPKNFGLYADTCIIRFELRSNNILISTKDTVYKAFKYRDTISYSFTLDSADIYQMTVTLDRNNRYNEENENNNTASITIPVKSTTFLALGPVDNSIVYGDSVELSGLNPNLISGVTSRVMVELDTSLSFNSPAKRLFINNSPTGPVTKFKTNFLQGTEGVLYHWRTFSVVNGDSSGWSVPMTFIYGGQIRSATGDDDRYINAQLYSQIVKSKKKQFPANTLFNTVSNDNGISLYEYPANLFVRSYGSNGEEASFFSVGEKNVYIDGGTNSGLNLIKVKRLNGDILQFLNLKMTSAVSSNDSLLNFLNTFDSTHYLMLLNAAYFFTGGTTLSSPVKARLRQFGSTKCDSIGLLSYFHTWSFIGYLGAPQSEVSEMFDPCCRPAPGCVSCDHWTESISTKNVAFRRQSGTVENIVGPANTWVDFSWDFVSAPNSSIKFDVIGIGPLGNDSLLMSNVTTNKFTALNQIDASLFPKLNLIAKFDIDYNTGGYSPLLRSINVNFSPAAELILEKNSLTIGTTDRKSNLINFSFTYHNAGYIFLNETAVDVFRNIISDTSRIFSDTVKRILKIDSSATYTNSFADNNRSAVTKYIFRVKPVAQIGEFYLFNNFAEYSTGNAIVSNSGSNTFALMLDGKEISGGEIVSTNPEAVIVYKGTSAPDLMRDTSKLAVRINGRYIPYFLQGSVNPVFNISSARDFAAGGSSLMLFNPQLNIGRNTLVLMIRNEQDGIDSLVYEVSTGGDLAESELYNYPNPMRDKTSFIFSMNEADAQGNISIRIYTSSGRLIKRLNSVLQPGLNTIEWDGKDDDGDFVANGTYLYKLVLEDGNENKTETKKLVVLK
jgi:hypothetical protein